MTDAAPVNKGTLSDKEGAGFPGCRILIDGETADRPFTVLPFVQKYIDAIPKKARVNFTTKDQKISKIWEDSPAPAGEQKKGDCTSPVSTPANGAGLKTVEGQIVAIDKPAHKITLKDKAGTSHTFIWAPALDAEFSKLNQWWFCKVTGEHEADVDLWRATGQGFFKRPEDWPASQHGGGKGGYSAPRNERIIVLQTCMKVVADIYALQGMSDPKDNLEIAMQRITTEAIKAADALCTAGKVL